MRTCCGSKLTSDSRGAWASGRLTAWVMMLGAKGVGAWAAKKSAGISHASKQKVTRMLALPSLACADYPVGTGCAGCIDFIDHRADKSVVDPPPLGGRWPKVGGYRHVG